MRTWAFPQGVKDFSVQELVAQPCVEALDVTILPGRSRFDEGGPGADRGDPLPDRPGNELRAVGGTDVGRDAAQDEQVGQDIDDVSRRRAFFEPGSPGSPG